MRKLFLAFLFLPLCFSACDEEEGCDSTIAPQRSAFVWAEVAVLDQNGDEVEDYPCTVSWQKWWCDGSYAMEVSYSENTNHEGVYLDVSPLYDLHNEEDYIVVTLEAGSGSAKQEWMKRVSYDAFRDREVRVSHTFYITR